MSYSVCQSLCLFVFVFCFFSCGNKNVPPPTSNAPTAEVAKQAETYKVVVKDLRLRDQPTQTGSAVLATLKEGDLLTFEGVASEKTEEIVLRGVKYNEPWLKMRTADGKEGWVYGGGVRKLTLNTGTGQNEAVDEAKANAFAGVIEALPKNKPESGGQALAQYQQIFTGANKATGDAGYRLLEQFFAHLVNDLSATIDRDAKFTKKDLDLLTEEVYARREGRKEPDMQRNAYTKRLDANGLRLAAAEGTLFVESHPGQIRDKVSAFVSPAMMEYLGMQGEEADKPSGEDAGIIIEMKKVADRAIAWEAFVQKYPGFILEETARQYCLNYRDMLLIGENNTPAFDYADEGVARPLNPEFKAAFEYVRQKSPNSELGRVIGELYDELKKSNFTYTESVASILKKYIKGYGTE